MNRLLCRASAPVLLLAMSASAFAQAQSDSVSLETVMVTARQLESAGVKEFTDVERIEVLRGPCSTRATA